MHLRNTLALLGLVSLALVTGCSCDEPDSEPVTLSGRERPTTAHVVQTVPHTAVEGRTQRFDVLADSQGTLHLAWQSAEGELHYQASYDQGRTWIQPIPLAAPSTPAKRYASFGNRPRLFLNGSELVVLWQERVTVPRQGTMQHLVRRSSPDRGRSWPLVEPLPRVELPPYDIYVRYDLLADGETLYLAYTSREGFFTRRSDDAGRSWTPPVKLADVHDPSYNAVHSTYVSLALRGTGLYGLWSDRNTEGRLYLASSHDRGDHWSPPVEVPVDLTSIAAYYETILYIHLPRLLPSDDGFHVFFATGGTFYQEVDTTGRVITPPRRVSNLPSDSPELAVLPLAADTLLVLWPDRRYQEARWWAKYGLLVALRFDNNPYLVNNDLLVSTLVEGAPSEPTVVTERLSFVWKVNGHLPQLCRVAPDRVYAFWSGRRKVGKTIDSHGSPTEIFFSRVF